jgi:hypothetical protein
MLPKCSSTTCPLPHLLLLLLLLLLLSLLLAKQRSCRCAPSTGTSSSWCCKHIPTWLLIEAITTTIM